jgi:hypothetical protein
VGKLSPLENRDSAQYFAFSLEKSNLTAKGHDGAVSAESRGIKCSPVGCNRTVFNRGSEASPMRRPQLLRHDNIHGPTDDLVCAMAEHVRSTFAPELNFTFSVYEDDGFHAHLCFFSGKAAPVLHIEIIVSSAGQSAMILRGRVP